MLATDMAKQKSIYLSKPLSESINKEEGNQSPLYNKCAVFCKI